MIVECLECAFLILHGGSGDGGSGSGVMNRTADCVILIVNTQATNTVQV